MSLNITAISFLISAVLSFFISLKTFYILKRQPQNKATRAFFQTLLFFFFYTASRALVSLFFSTSAEILTIVYIVSHIFLGLASAFLAKFAALNFFDENRARKTFFSVALLFASDVILNIFLPNSPEFNFQLNIIKWGTNKYVGIYHTFLLWLVLFGVAAFFFYRAYKKPYDKEVRLRSLIIAAGLIFSIIIVVPINIFPSAIFVLISNIGYIFTFALILWAITLPVKNSN
jgi:hypothetical protein